MGKEQLTTSDQWHAASGRCGGGLDGRERMREIEAATVRFRAGNDRLAIADPGLAGADLETEGDRRRVRSKSILRCYLLKFDVVPSTVREYGGRRETS